MRRRTFLQSGLSLACGTPLLAALRENKFEAAAKGFQNAVESGLVHAAAVYVKQGPSVFTRSFGAETSVDSIFLLASISKTITTAAVMSLFDQQQFQLDDRVRKFIPEFSGEGRETITMRQLLTHVSGLPDQLPENAELRARHAPLKDFVQAAIRTPLLFHPGAKYSYSSMAILLATEVAQRISGTTIADLTDQAIFRPLQMKRSALGLGQFQLEEVIRCQTEYAAPESGAGDPSTTSWDWNSRYWRTLGAPWGTAHGSASDVAIFMNSFLHPNGEALKPATCQLMITNHNPAGLHPRGLGFDLGQIGGTTKCSPQTFGHTGSTGTLCWADPKTDTICVVLTSLPGRAITPHPRTTFSNLIAAEAAQ